MPASEPLGVAFVGCGNIAGPYAETMKPHADRLRLVGAFDINPEATTAFAAKHGCKAYSSLEELLADEAVELAVNLTTHLAHAEVTQRLLRGGKHVHSEKPLAATRDDAQACLDLAAERGLQLTCSPFVILGEAQQAFKKAIADGLIGEPREVYAEMNWSRIENWHPAPAPFYGPGAGPLLDVGCYPLHVLTQVFGPVALVRAMAGIRLGERVIASGPNAGQKFRVTSHDHACVLMEFRNGVRARLTTTFFALKSAQQGIEAHGTEGSLKLESVIAFDSAVRLFRQEQDDWRDLPLPAGAYQGVEWARGLLDAADALRSGRPPTCPGAAAYHILDVSLAALEAAESGGTVAVASTLDSPG